MKRNPTTPPACPFSLPVRTDFVHDDELRVIDADGRQLTISLDPDRAAYIAHAVNSHAALVADLAAARAESAGLSERVGELLAERDRLRELLGQVLARLELEREECGPDAVFPCAAMIEPIRAALGSK